MTQCRAKNEISKKTFFSKKKFFQKKTQQSRESCLGLDNKEHVCTVAVVISESQIQEISGIHISQNI